MLPIGHFHAFFNAKLRQPGIRRYTIATGVGNSNEVRLDPSVIQTFSLVAARCRIDMPNQLKDHIVVITGSTRGFGYSTAEAMLRAGATVVITGRSQEAIRRAVGSLAAIGPVSGEELDVRNEAQVYQLVERVVEQYGHIDIWINNAGYSASAGLMLETDPREALDMFLANDLGVLHCTQAVLAHMMPRKTGTLVNIYGNGSFLRPATPTGLYGTTKAWVTSFTRSLAKELKGSGIKVLGFSPGMLLTDMLTKPRIIGEHGRDMMKRYDLVLRVLSGSPTGAAERLVQTVSTQRQEFRRSSAVQTMDAHPWAVARGMAKHNKDRRNSRVRTPLRTSLSNSRRIHKRL